MNRIDEIKKHLNSTSEDGEASVTIFTADDVRYLVSLNERLTRIVLHKTGEDKLKPLPPEDIRFIAQLRIENNLKALEE